MKRFEDSFAIGEQNLNKDTSSVVDFAGKSFENKSEAPEREQREKVFTELENLGFIQKESGETIFDTERFKKEISKSFILANKELSSFFIKYGERKVAPTLCKLLSDYKVISTEDYAKGVVEPKDLLYLPKNAEDALDIEKIKESQFYLTLKDIVSNVSYDKLNYGDITDLDYREVLLPVLIYHPQYGDGKRDEKTGKLMVRKNETEYQKFSSEYLYRKHGALRDNVSGTGIDSGRRFLRKVTPHLLEKDLIRLADFQIKQGQGEETEINSRKIGRKGFVMFDNVRHTLGSRYENSSAHRLSDTLGAIVEEKDDKNREKKIVALFDVISKDEAEITTSQGYKSASIAQSNPKVFNWKEFKNKKEDETLEEYGERVEKMESFEYVLQSERYLRDELGINLEKFSPKEQLMIARMLNSVSILKKEKINSFIINHGDNGLKSFLSLEHGGQEMGEKILSIGEKLEKSQADMVFEKYAQLVEASSEVEAYITEQFGNENATEAREVAERLLVRGKKLLEIVTDSTQLSPESLQKVLNKIEAVRKDTEIFKATFKNMREKGIEVPFEKMKDTRINSFSGQELLADPKMILKMKEIITKNYGAYPKEFQEMILASFDKKTGDSNINFEIATYKDPKKKDNSDNGRELMTFLTMTTGSNGRLYFGSFNINNDIFQGAEIGRAFFEETMKNYGQGETPIDAHCNPEENISKTYIESGFTATDIVEISDVPSFSIAMDKSRHYSTKNIPQNELFTRIGEKSNNLVIRKKEPRDSFAELKNGFVLTRYFDQEGSTVVVFELA